MKRVFLISLLFSLIAGFASAEPKNTFTVSDLNIAQKGDKIYVDFTAKVGPEATSSNYNLTVVPILSDNKELKRELRPIVIQGHRARIAYERNYRNTGFDPFREAVFASNDATIRYTATLPFETWMSGADLVLDGVTEGCCSGERLTLDAVAKNLLASRKAYVEPQPEVVPVVEKPIEKPVEKLVEKPVGKPVGKPVEQLVVAPVERPAEPAKTVGDALARQYVFMEPVENLVASGQFDKDKAIVIYFKVNRNEIERNFRTNYQSLVELISVVRTMEKSNDGRIARVVIAGYASPEGTLARNNFLARSRAEALRDFIKVNTSVDVSDITLYSGGEDWTGLRAMVAASNMLDRQRVLDIIDAPRVWNDHHPANGRLAQLKRLNNGETYRYMFNNFFPDLRNATYIRVFYENNK
ncbi:hypothetical protein FACS1894159_05170 [Bacteroidia bacterium]|nr:hypothetical protein FACS1894159_05170 [Bacteroidia bacterium]